MKYDTMGHCVADKVMIQIYIHNIAYTQTWIYFVGLMAKKILSVVL